MKHFFHNSKESDGVFILLHGTGGRETDLLTVAGRIDPSFSVLGIRGEMVENGQFRYFKRNKDGSMNDDSLITETSNILNFIEEAAKTYAFKEKNIHLIGYSNGANMAVSLILHKPELFRSAQLFHPSHPLKTFKYNQLSKLNIFITAGALDQLVLPGEAVKLKQHLNELGAKVSLFMTDYGHDLRTNEFTAAKKWWNENIREDGEDS